MTSRGAAFKKRQCGHLKRDLWRALDSDPMIAAMQRYVCLGYKASVLPAPEMTFSAPQSFFHAARIEEFAYTSLPDLRRASADT